MSIPKIPTFVLLKGLTTSLFLFPSNRPVEEGMRRTNDRNARRMVGLPYAMVLSLFLQLESFSGSSKPRSKHAFKTKEKILCSPVFEHFLQTFQHLTLKTRSCIFRLLFCFNNYCYVPHRILSHVFPFSNNRPFQLKDQAIQRTNQKITKVNRRTEQATGNNNIESTKMTLHCITL